MSHTGSSDVHIIDVSFQYKVRLRVLIDKQKSMRLRNPVISKTSTHYVTLEQGFRDFIKDLSKLQVCICT